MKSSLTEIQHKNTALEERIWPEYCGNYHTLNSTIRAFSSPSGKNCDQLGRGDKFPQWNGPGNYRFMGPMKRMATKAEVSTKYVCGTHAAGYIEDPAAHDDLQVGHRKESVKVCFYYSRPCQWNTTIAITHCFGGFFVYTDATKKR